MFIYVNKEMFVDSSWLCSFGNLKEKRTFMNIKYLTVPLNILLCFINLMHTKTSNTNRLNEYVSKQNKFIILYILQNS